MRSGQPRRWQPTDQVIWSSGSGQFDSHPNHLKRRWIDLGFSQTDPVPGHRLPFYETSCCDKMPGTTKGPRRIMSSAKITPDQAKFVFALALPTLKAEHATTKRVIEAIPPDKGDYRPDSVSKTAVELAWHIVAAEKRFLGGVCAGAFDYAPIPRPDTVRKPRRLPHGLMRALPRT
jgi:hypothetical protein